MRVTVCRSGLIPAMAFVLSSCGPEDAADRGVTVRDSVGVEIVGNHSPAWVEGEAWVVESSPLVSIGSLDGDDAYVFTRIVTTLLDDGGVAVVEQQAAELRLFDVDGVHRITAGGRGEGPGELSFPDGVGQIRGDSIAVTQGDPPRVTIYDSEGRYARTWSLPGGGYGVQAFSGAMDLFRLGLVLSGRYDGYERGRAIVVRTDSTGSVDTLASFSGSDRFMERVGERGVAYFPVPFGRASTAAFEPDRFHIGNGDVWEIATHSLPDGGLVRVARIDIEPDAVTDEVWERSREASLAGYSSEYIEQRGPEIRERWERTPRLETMPAYDRVLVDSTGHLWVRQFAPDWERTTDWNVIDPDGRWLGMVPFPPGLNVVEIDEDRVLGIATDELGVVRLRVHALRR